MISMKYVSFVGVVNGKRTEGHKTREGAEKEIIELMKKENANGYSIQENIIPGVSWRCLDN